MSYKVLLADDSLTIQKVIKITLANEPYELIECNNVDEIYSNLEKHNPTMVFLDFTLSENESGYEVSKEVLRRNPNTKVLMMYGTFDTIEDADFKESGASGKIVKPFDSTKFINICRDLTHEDDELEISNPILDAISDHEPEVIEDVQSDDDFSEESEWIVNAPQAMSEELPGVIEEEEEVEEVQSELTEPIKNNLESSIEDWGMAVPGVIDEASDNNPVELPPVIEEESQSLESIPSEETLPSDDDLEYPDLDSMSMDDLPKFDEGLKEEKVKRPSSMFTSLDDLASTEDAIPEEDSFFGTESEEQLVSLQAQIGDEDEDDLWSADEVEEASFEVEEEIIFEEIVEEIVEEKPEEVALDDLEEFDTPIYEDKVPEEIITAKLDSVEESIEEITEVAAAITPSIDLNELKSEVTKELRTELTQTIEDKIESIVAAKLEAIVKDSVQKYFERTSEKVAWDIIPDLAENIIKREIEKISSSVINQ